MTDPSTPSSPEPNTPPPAASAPPAYTPTSGAPAGTAPKRGLSLAGFIVGLAATVFFWTSWFAIIVGVVGLILSLVARSKEPASPRWMKILGLVFSIVGIVLGALILIIFIAIGISAANDPRYN